MDNDSDSLTILRSYFILSAVTGIIICLPLLRAGWQAVTGVSSDNLIARFGLLFFVALLSLGFTILALNMYRRREGHNHQVVILVLFDRRSARTALSIMGLVVYALGTMYLFSASPGIYGPTYPIWLIPFFIWMASLGLLTVIHMALLSAGDSIKEIFRMVLLLVILTTGILVNLQFWAYELPRQEDIYYIYLDGGRLSDGSNPYERVLSGDMQVNDKYSTYLPGFYYLSSGVQRLGLTVFAGWLSFWRVVFLVANLSIATLLFFIPGQKHLTALAVFAAMFWLFNRWTLHVSKTADIDFIPLFFMLLSLYLYRRNTAAAYLILGLSLGIKQMAVFLVPMYLIWAWREGPHAERIKRVAIAIVLIGLIPLLISIPFLVWNWEGFLRSILFSVTRDAAASFNVYSLDVVLGLRGIPARLPMHVMLALVYWLTWKLSINHYIPAFLTMAVFVFFNSVFFTSYMIWVAALIPLAAYEYITVVKDKGYLVSRLS